VEGHNEVALGLARLPRTPKDHIDKDVGQQGVGIDKFTIKD